MPVKFANDKPIFIQLAEMIRGSIISGRFGANEKLPSVRDLAMEYSVNPNTVQKSLQILEDEGLIVTDRTNGKFVADSLEDINLQKTKSIKQEVDMFVGKMKSFGLSINEIKEIINNMGE